MASDNSVVFGPPPYYSVKGYQKSLFLTSVNGRESAQFYLKQLLIKPVQSNLSLSLPTAFNPQLPRLPMHRN